MSPKIIQVFLLLSATLLFSACAGSLFKVKPVTELPPLPEESRNVNSGTVTLRVAPLLTDEQTQELFEANVQLTGILPVRIELAFEGEQVIALNKARFRLRDAEGREWKWVSPKKAAARIRKANGITLYNPNAKKQFEEQLGSYGIDLTTPVSGSDARRSGFLFFQTPDKRAVEHSQKLTLTIERLPQPISVLVN